MKNDSSLQLDVMRALAQDPDIDAVAIGVSVHHGIVTLNGLVSCWAEKHAAGETAHRVPGVLDLANEIEIKPCWNTRASDGDIAEAVRRALASEAAVPHERLQTPVTDDGHVTLTGAVATLRERDAAERAVRDLSGVKILTNAITIEAPRAAAFDQR